MRIAIINPLLRFGADESQWITVPPQGYGGIQWVVATLIDGLVDDQHDVLLLGAPGSAPSPRVTVSAATTAAQMSREIAAFGAHIVHDHSNERYPVVDAPVVRTHHLSGGLTADLRCTFLSTAQRDEVGATKQAPVIPLPVNLERYSFRRDKDDFLLFLGRVSPHKGVSEAAEFARAAGLHLVIAGPVWEKEYAATVQGRFSGTARFVGEVGGARRRELLAHARAVMVLSQPVTGPWGGTWCEPGATVVSEAAASGTPVIASDNGCLPEIVPGVGHLLTRDARQDRERANDILAHLPQPLEVRTRASHRWGHRHIARRYVDVYRDVVGGDTWGTAPATAPAAAAEPRTAGSMQRSPH